MPRRRQRSQLLPPRKSRSPYENDEVKFVITNREDYDFTRDFIREHALHEKAGQVLLSPAFVKIPSPQRTADNMALDPRKLVEWMLADGLPHASPSRSTSSSGSR